MSNSLRYLLNPVDQFLFLAHSGHLLVILHNPLSHRFGKSLRVKVFVLLKLDRRMDDHLHRPRSEQYRTPQQAAMGPDKSHWNDGSFSVAGQPGDFLA